MNDEDVLKPRRILGRDDKGSDSGRKECRRICVEFLIEVLDAETRRVEHVPTSVYGLLEYYERVQQEARLLK